MALTEEDEAPVCPGCKQPAKPYSYPPGMKSPWWCNPCLKRKVRECGKR